MKRRLEDRFWSKVDKTGDCWEWAAYRDRTGYGRFWFDAKLWLAHRLAYELAVGPIPRGADLDHTCSNRSCVRPEHLRPATNKQNGENRKGANSNSRSGVRGVSWYPSTSRWRTVVVHNGKHHRKYFTDFDEACAHVIELRNQLYTHNDADRTSA